MKQDLKLQPLACQSCGGSVPLSDGPVSTCPFCQTQTEIPAEYQSWRLRQQDLIRAEENVAALSESLGRSPNALERALVSLDGKAGGCAMAFLILMLGNIVAEMSISALNYVTGLFSHYVTPDSFGATFLSILIVGPFALVAVTLLLGLVYLRRRVLTLAKLQASFVASAPVHPGGPVGCRNCGASLEVEEGKVSVCCGYCCTNNLVSLDPAWAEKLRSGEKQANLSLAEALDVFDQETQAGKSRLLKYGLVSMGFLLGFIVLLSPVLNKQPSFSDNVSDHRLLTQEKEESLPLGHPITFRPNSEKTHGTWAPFRHDGTVSFKVALKDTDKIKVDFLGEPGQGVEVRFGVHSKNQKWELAKTLKPGESAEFDSATNRWLTVWLVPDEKTRESGFRMRISVGESPAPKTSPLALDALKIGELELGEVIDRNKDFLVDAATQLKGEYKGYSVELDEYDRILSITNLAGKASSLSIGGKTARAFLTTYGLGDLSIDEKLSGAWVHRYQSKNRELELWFQKGVPREVKLRQVSPLPKADGPKKVAVDKPTIISLSDYEFKKDVGLSVRGLKPGAPRGQVEKVLGKPRLEWQNCALYEHSVACYREDKLFWICSDVITQGSVHIKVSGFDDSISEKLSKSFSHDSQLRTLDQEADAFDSQSIFKWHKQQTIGLHKRQGQLFAITITDGKFFQDKRVEIDRVKPGEFARNVGPKRKPIKLREKATGQRMFRWGDTTIRIQKPDKINAISGRFMKFSGMFLKKSETLPKEFPLNLAPDLVYFALKKAKGKVDFFDTSTLEWNYTFRDGTVQFTTKKNVVEGLDWWAKRTEKPGPTEPLE